MSGTDLAYRAARIDRYAVPRQCAARSKPFPVQSVLSLSDMRLISPRRRVCLRRCRPLQSVTRAVASPRRSTPHPTP
eukprot:2817874-Rhodomonas_salina.1